MATIEKRTTGDGKTSYRVKIRMKGEKPVTATFDKLTDAKTWISQTETEIKQGRYFQKSEGRKHTLGELITDYLPTIEKKKDYSNAKRHLEWWKERIGEKFIADVTPALLSQIKDELANGITPQGKKRSPATVNRYLISLSGVLAKAAGEQEYIETSPMTKVKKLDEPEGRIRFLSEQERDALLDACRNSRSKQLYPITVLALSTGMRRGEILSIRWRDVDFDRKRIVLYDTKNGSSRQVPLAGAATEELKSMLAAKKAAKVQTLKPVGDDLVFPGKMGEPVDFRDAWETAVKKAKIDNFRFHDCRHTAASYLAMNGATLLELSQILGHKTLAMVKRYAHLTEQHLHNVVERMNTAFLSGQGNGKGAA
jgi:integrase